MKPMIDKLNQSIVRADKIGYKPSQNCGCGSWLIGVTTNKLLMSTKLVVKDKLIESLTKGE